MKKWQYVAFPLALKNKGYDEKGNRWRVDPQRHLMRIEGNTPALALEAIQWWSKNGISFVTVHLTDGRRMVTDLAEFMSGAHQMAYVGQGRQYVNRDAWQVLKKTA